MRWHATDKLLHATLSRSFVPLQKHPELVYTSLFYQDIYIGAELYIFAQTEDEKWCRAYLCSRPMPEDYISNSTSHIGQQLPDVIPRIVIVPRKYIIIHDSLPIDQISFFKKPEPSDFTCLLDEKCDSPSLFQTLNPKMYHVTDSGSDSSINNNLSGVTSTTSSSGSLKGGEAAILNTKRPTKPSFPYFRFQDRPIQDEMGVMLTVLCSHIYVMYSSNEFIIYDNLIKLYHNIDRLRFKLKYNLTTERDKVRIIRTSCELLAQISKYFSTKGRTNKLHLTASSNLGSNLITDTGSNISTTKHNPMLSDPYGYEGIFARDIVTGNLLQFNDSSLKTIVSKSLAYGLTNSNLLSLSMHKTGTSDSNSIQLAFDSKLHQFLTTNVLMDFQNIISDPSINDPKLDKIIMSVYLINKDQEHLTEPFHIDLRNINHQTHQYSNNFILDTMSTVLFKTLPRSMIDNDKIYLVVILREEIKIAFKNNVTASSFKAPFMLIEDPTVDSRVHKIKRGVCIGITDITSIFMRDKLFNNNTNVDENEDISHKVKVNLYTSLLEDDNQEKSDNKSTNASINSLKPLHLNHGWGSIIPNILNDSTSGIIVNPRAISINVTMKELPSNSSSFNVSSLIINSTENYGNTNADDKVEKMYLKMGKVSLSGVTKRVTNIRNVVIKTVSVSKNLKFNKNSNETKLNSWTFTSVSPGESMNETTTITNMKTSKIESLRVLAYLNGYLMAQGVLPIIKNGKVIEFPKGKTIQLSSSQGNTIIDLEVTTSYYGHYFNTPSILRDFNRLLVTTEGDPQDVNVEEFKEKCEKVLNSVEHLNINRALRHFEDIIIQYLKLLEQVVSLELLETKLPENIVLSLLKYFKLTVSNKDYDCKEKFFKFFERYLKLQGTLPQVGALILKEFSNLLNDKHLIETDEINLVCIQSMFLYMLSFIAMDDKEEWGQSCDVSIEQVCDFIKLPDSGLLAGQNGLLDGFDAWVQGLDVFLTDDTILKYTENMIQSSKEREILQGMNERNLNDEEIRYLNSKFMLLQHVICHKKLKARFFEQENVDPVACRFLRKSIEWVLRSSLILGKSHPSILTLRLSNTVLMYIAEHIKDKKIMRNMLRLIPTCCTFFIHMKKYCKENGLLKPKRTFNNLFPTTVNPISIPMDSIVNDDIVVEVLLEIATIICQLAKIASRIYGTNPSFEAILEECKYDKEFDSLFFVTEMKKEYAFTITRTVKTLITGDYFSAKRLLGITALMARCSIKLLTLCKKFMIGECTDIESSTPEAEINRKLWVYYLKCILMVSNHKVSALLKLAIIPRKAVYGITGDLKKQISHLLDSTWDALGQSDYDAELERDCGIGHVSKGQYNLIFDNPILLREIMISSFHNHIDSTKVCCKIIWSLVISSWKHMGSLQPLLNISIPELYNAYAEGRLLIDDEELDKYTRCVMLTVHIPTKHPLFNANLTFFQELLGFLQIVTELYKLPELEEFDEDRVARHIEMFSYFIDANRPELFHKLINDIFIHSIKKHDYVQAGLSLELLANTYSWDPNDYLPSAQYPPLPEQSSFERKEYLYKEAARNFSRGLKLEKALSVYKDLIKAYDEINYDLNGLAFVHDQISQIYTEMQSIDRLVPTYFKVSFMGYGFPLALRNKIFIFEGLPFEHISSMHNRLLKVYHGSTIVNTQEETDQLLAKTKMGKFINVVTVEPQLELSEEYISRTKNSLINNRVRLYVENRDLRTFRNSRRLPGSKSMTDLWVEEYTYTTVDTFPTLTYRSFVESIRKRNLSPIENAVRTLQTKIQDLTGLENMCYKVLKDQDESLNIFKELSRNLTGTISAPINGGIAEYKEFLQEPKCQDFNPDDINKLTLLFDQLTVVLSHCLILHEKLQPVNRPPESHKILTELFQENFGNEIERNHINLAELTVEDIIKYKTTNTVTNQRETSSRSMLRKTTAPRDPFKLHHNRTHTMSLSSERNIEHDDSSSSISLTFNTNNTDSLVNNLLNATDHSSRTNMTGVSNPSLSTRSLQRAITHLGSSLSSLEPNYKSGNEYTSSPDESMRLL